MGGRLLLKHQLSVKPNIYPMKLTFSFFCACLLTLSLSATEVREYTKTIDKEFDITADGKTSVSNKHGKLTVKTWNQNKVKVNVIVRVETGNDKDAQDVLDDITVDFSNSASSVSIETIFNKGWNNSWNRKYRNIDIDMTVTLPSTNNLRLRHRHGNTTLDDMSGPVDIDIAHGNLSAGSFKGETEIEIAHGSGDIENASNIFVHVSHGKLLAEDVGNVEVDLSHGTFEANNAGDISSSSAHSRLYLGDIGMFRSTRSSHDNIRVGKAKSMRLYGSHSNITVKEVQNELELDMNHGSARSGLGSNFTEVSIDGSHTSFELNIAEGANYRMDASTEHAGLNYPNGLNVNYHVEKNHNKTVKGYMGSENTQNQIVAKLSHGSLRVYN